MFNLFKKNPQRSFTSKDVLKAFDQSATGFHFPILDNGYIYLAASRLSLYRSTNHWAIVFETFGFSPRAGQPDLTVTTISNKLHHRDLQSNYASAAAYQNYLTKMPNTDLRNFWPISDTNWIDEDESEHVVSNSVLSLRGQSIAIPKREEIEATGIQLNGDRVAVFELCRFLGAKHRLDVLGTDIERRVSVSPELQEIMILDDWHHPDLAAGQLPSQTETFQKLSNVLESGNASLFEVSEKSNNHWENWPEGGEL